MSGILTEHCGTSCWTMVYCRTCRRQKGPRGRSVPPAATYGYCNDGCSGYRKPPKPPHLWPHEAPGRGGQDD